MLKCLWQLKIYVPYWTCRMWIRWSSFYSRMIGMNRPRPRLSMLNRLSKIWILVKDRDQQPILAIRHRLTITLTVTTLTNLVTMMWDSLWSIRKTSLWVDLTRELAFLEWPQLRCLPCNSVWWQIKTEWRGNQLWLNICVVDKLVEVKDSPWCDLWHMRTWQTRNRRHRRMRSSPACLHAFLAEFRQLYHLPSLGVRKMTIRKLITSLSVIVRKFCRDSASNL